MSRARLIVAIITTLLDEAIIIVLFVWGFPALGIRLPVPVLVVVGLLWTAFAVLLYVTGTKALRRKQLPGQTEMTGTKGIVVRALKPQGMVKINSELWAATSIDGEDIQKGEKIVVESQSGLKLTVRKVT